MDDVPVANGMVYDRSGTDVGDWMDAALLCVDDEFDVIVDETDDECDICLASCDLVERCVVLPS